MPSAEVTSRKIVIFFLPCVGLMPSGVRRALDYEPYLATAGIDPLWLGYTPLLAYQRYTQAELGGKSLILRFLRTVSHYGWRALISVGRVWSLLRLLILAPRAAGIFMQWVTPPAWYTRLLRRVNPNIAFDFDDAVFLLAPKAAQTLTRSSRVVAAGSHFNLEYAQRWNSRCVFLPTPVPADRFDNVRVNKPSSPIVIGWVGSFSTLQYLELVVRVLDRVARQHSDVVLRVIGCGNRPERVPSFSQIKCEIVPWIPYTEVPTAVSRFDIGIMPLARTDWEKGKCVLKALEYMAAGVPPVVSRFGENVYAISDGVDGFLADSEDEWVEKILRLVECSGLRAEMGAAARRTVLARFSTEVCSKILIDQVLRPLCD